MCKTILSQTQERIHTKTIIVGAALLAALSPTGCLSCSSLNPACLLSAPIDRDLSTCRSPDLSGKILIQTIQMQFCPSPSFYSSSPTPSHRAPLSPSILPYPQKTLVEKQEFGYNELKVTWATRKISANEPMNPSTT